MAADEPIARTLRWLYFVLGAGSLIACGVYIARAAALSGSTAKLLSALMFLLLGLFWILMYGEHDSRQAGETRRPPESD